MPVAHYVHRIIPVAILACALGCGSKDPNRGEVTGIVTVNGQPVAAGAVAFSPIDGQSPTSGGKIVDGRYKVQAWTGTARVAIRVPEVAGERKLYNTADSPVRPVMRESLPAEYNDRTTLTFDVKPGDNEHNFELRTN